MTHKRSDGNQQEIMDALRRAGFFVVDIHVVGNGIPDLLATSRSGRAVLLEVKARDGYLNQAEQKFFSCYPGPVVLVRSAEEAIRTMELFS